MRLFALSIFTPIALMGWTQLAPAGEWTITPGITVEEEYTDNANLATDGEDRESDFITTIAPSIAIDGISARSSLNLNYTYSRLFYARGTNDATELHDLSAIGNLEYWKNRGFIDAEASISREVLDSSAPSTDTAAGETQNQTEVQFYEVSPYFQHQFGTWALSETRATFNTVINDDDGDDTANTIGQIYTITIDSGRRFQRLGSTLILEQRKRYFEDDTPASRAKTVDALFTYVVNRQFGLLAGVGYEDVESSSLGITTTGVTWSAGFTYNPSSRTSLVATVGHNFGEREISVAAVHQLSSRTSYFANYSEGPSTSEQDISEELASSQNLDATVGGSGTSSDFDFTTAPFFQRRFAAGVTGTRQQNTFDFDVSWESQNTFATGETQEVAAVALELGRQLSLRAAASVQAEYENTEFDDAQGRIDDTLTLSGDLTYQLSGSADVTLSFERTQTWSNVDGNDLTENTVTVGLTKTF